jgi:hypothetical protein
MTNEQEETYRRLAATARQIAKQISEFEVQAIQSDLSPEVKLRIMDWGQGYQALAYFLTPQSHWTGGNSYEVHAPHIEFASAISAPQSRGISAQEERQRYYHSR